MRPNKLTLLILSLLFCAIAYAITPGIAQSNMLQLIEKEFQKVVAASRPAIVRVVATHQLELPSFPSEIQKTVLTRQSVGSGIVIDAAGHVVTTTFDSTAQQIEVVFHDGKRAEAELLGEDVMTDIAVLRVKTVPSREDAQIHFGNSADIDSGSWVVTVGSSYGASPVISFGIVGGWDILPNSHCAEVIKINAPVTPGNSGGAVVNTTGEVVGMILAVLTDAVPEMPTVMAGDDITEFRIPPMAQSWVTFAVPIETVLSVAKEIIAHGKVARGWLGVQIEMGESGVFITRVTENGPAHKSGLLPKDVILQFNEHPVENYPQLLRCVMTAAPHTRVNLKIYRNGQEMNRVVTLGER